jgi:hypothetical protein
MDRQSLSRRSKSLMKVSIPVLSCMHEGRWMFVRKENVLLAERQLPLSRPSRAPAFGGSLSPLLKRPKSLFHDGEADGRP